MKYIIDFILGNGEQFCKVHYLTFMSHGYYGFEDCIECMKIRSKWKDELYKNGSG